ncbi:glycosyltransferase involved in cell wall biosynthesis [Pelomonas aquatica]|uniref:Glycosyltransferase involved in cell wall biosynthesis n=1 Tax=Pelomonas aquatica TaxID=431058 RepID=A0ABU1Z5B9_9BURK|nr:glycosyltransferase family 4 protein [Pelomonas aquatica]MDR7295814.1 glycosyltransferase involved in cell wall biosynthesis [Pelomonas aquatica]
MKILFQSRFNLFTAPGGDTVQLMKTAEYLRRLGVEVDIGTVDEPDLAGYDLVHLFNLMRAEDVYFQALNARRQGVPVALSTIYGLYTEFERKARGGWAGVASRRLSAWNIERLKIVAKGVKNRNMSKGAWLVALLGYHRQVERLAELVDVFLPNSHGEMGRVHQDYPVSRSRPFEVVPNAVDVEVFDPARVKARPEIERLRGCVVSAARIEGRKCQVELVRAMKDLPVDLVLIGKPAMNDIGYYNAVQREAGSRVHFVGQIDHAQLAEYLSVAKAHALISWMETPGLSSLEAGAMGCNLVITAKGDTRDYFGDGAFYADPESVPSIRAALEQALSAPAPEALQRRIRDEYTWEKAAAATLRGYEAALSRVKSGGAQR